MSPEQEELPLVAPPTKLARILHNTIDAAGQTGQDQRVHLSGGAVVIARVRSGVAFITIKRQGVAVGAVELKTFLRDAGVPQTAGRIPAEGQGERDGWFFVTFKWAIERSDDARP